MDILDSKSIQWLSSIIIDNFQLEKPAYSDQSEVFKIISLNANYYLKIGSSLETERSNTIKLGPFIAVPEVVAFKNIDKRDHLLLTEVAGKNLCEFINEWTPAYITKKFAQTVKEFHSLDPYKLFLNARPNSILLHGDMSLPNVIFTQDGLSGIIDLGHLSTGSADLDITDALWSLQRNLGSGYGELFLEEYGGVEITPRIDEALRFIYTP